MAASSALDRLAELGFELPAPTPGQYSYTPFVDANGVGHVSGQIPKRDGTVAFTGAVLDHDGVARAQDAAQLAALGALAQIEHAIGLDRVAQVLKLTVYVASGPEFDDQPAVAEGASKLLRNVLGEAGAHARTAFGVPRLPKNATVELDLVVGLHDETGAPHTPAVAPGATSHNGQGSLDADLDSVLAAADAAAPELAALPPRRRAALLVALADALESERESLVAIAERETGLTIARLTGEVTRTAVQLRLFAEAVVSGAHLDARIDEADADFALGARPDLRRTHIPVGPVLNFSASNFPFAFSVLGGDSASILAAGCPLIVKAHSGHPDLSDATAALAKRVIAAADLPGGTLQVLHGQETGVAALRDPRVRAASFTGSTHGGRILADIAAARPAPIPFYGELGSINPVFITDTAITERGSALAGDYLASVGGSAGQLCTKPGLVFVHEGSGFAEAVRVAADTASGSEHRLLGPRIAAAYATGLDAVRALAGVEELTAGAIRIDTDGQGWVTPTIVRVSLETLRAHRELLAEELFGPFSVVIEVPAGAAFAPLVSEFIEGSLTGTVHLGEAEGSATAPPAALQQLVSELAERSGRVLFNGWPTGVAVTPAQQHGGPWPATTNDASTSVGTAALGRFLRPVAYQNAPAAFLPETLRDANPLGVPQSRSAAGQSLSWGRTVG